MIVFKNARTGRIVNNEKQIELMRKRMREKTAQRRLLNPVLVEGQTIISNSVDSFMIGDSVLDDAGGDNE